jgi:hypothetical protein
MIMVCKQHVKEGIKLFLVPHLKKLTFNNNKVCYFCEQKASFKLDIPYESTSRQKDFSML